MSILLIQVSYLTFKLLNIFLRKLKVTSVGQSVLSMCLLPKVPGWVHSVDKYNNEMKCKLNVEREMAK